MKMFILLFTFLLMSSHSFAQKTSSVKATYADIEKTLGIVPTFMKFVPDAALEGAWQDMKGIQLNASSAIEGKYKELIGLAVASQIPCKYCVYFHTQAALTNGATKEQVKEAVTLAASTRRWSTVLNGNQIDYQAFKNDVDKIHQRMQKKQNVQAMEEKPVPINTPEDAYRDIEQTLGFIPVHLKNYPKNGIVGAWKEMKALEMNPESNIPGEYKHLLSLAVASQVPCDYCTYYHTQSAMLSNSNQERLQEAVAMAAVTRHWSTILNGQEINDSKFRSETQQIMKFVKGKAAKEVTSR